MQCSVCEWNTILVKVVANRNLSAEGITATIKVYLVVLIIACLYQYRNMQVSNADSIDDTYLESEVRKRYDDTVYTVTVLAE